MSSKTKAPQGAVRPFGWQDKLGYAMGDMGCGFSFQLVSTFMQLFYLQYIGLSPNDYAIIILISKAFDAVNDIVIGNLVDTKRIGKKSKYMPWILLGGVTLIVFNVMIFAPVKDFSYAGKYAWCLVSYCLWSIAYTMVNVPYGSLHSVITDDPQQRVSLSTFRSIGAALPAIVIMIVLPGIVYSKSTDASGVEVQTLKGETLLPVAIAMSIFAMIVLYGTTVLVKERVNRDATENATGIKAMLSSVKSFFTNRAMVGATIASVASVALFNSTMALNNMVFQYFFKDTGKVGIAMVGSYAPMIVFMVLLGKLTKKYGKKNVLVVTMLIGTISGIVSLFAPITPDGTGMLVYIVCLMGLNVGNAVFQISVWAIIADCIEVSYRKTGKSEEGSLYALYSFFRKLSQGIGQAVVSWGLVAIGFVEGENAVQAADFGDKVKSLYFIVLAAGSLIAFLAMKFIYNIGKKEEEEMAFAAKADNDYAVGKGVDD
ncbi:MAG: glycoside-pentoside-hexuronide (GPH):cation symporter [Acutalibacteraceae bacterium]|nr:glycoside-pentoside-hexuronide (GPH):cation symporter [Acutalibacteraceae bacterium]